MTNILPKKPTKPYEATGLVIFNGAKIQSITAGDSNVTVDYELAGEAKTLEVDKLIVAIGRCA